MRVARALNLLGLPSRYHAGDPRGAAHAFEAGFSGKAGFAV
jgi:hypothetical protein